MAMDKPDIEWLYTIIQAAGSQQNFAHATTAMLLYVQTFLGPSFSE